MKNQGTETKELLRGITCTSSTLRSFDDGEICERTLLWRGVILRVFQDAEWDLNGIRKQSNYRDAYNTRASALIWLRGNSRDFHEVCDLAKCDPGAVRDAARTVFNGAIDELQIPIDMSDARAIISARSV